MSTFDAKYTPDQREAVALARVDVGMRPKDIAAAAAAGVLELHGVALEPFTIPPASIGTYAKRLRDERAGRATGQLADQPHRDAVETLRRRMVNAADATLAAWEKQRPADRDPERGRQIARLVRETAALPARTDPTPPRPGAKVDGEQLGGQTRGGIAGALLQDHRRTAAPTAQDAPPHPENSGDTGHGPEDHNATSHQHADSTTPPTTPRTTNHEQDDHAPGSAVRELAVRRGVAGV